MEHLYSRRPYVKTVFWDSSLAASLLISLVTVILLTRYFQWVALGLELSKLLLVFLSISGIRKLLRLDKLEVESARLAKSVFTIVAGMNFCSDLVVLWLLWRLTGGSW